MKHSLGVLMTLAAIMTFFVSCRRPNVNPVGEYADMVVYGRIFTSEADSIVEAFAVRDGKYIYVGTEADVQQYIGDRTRIIRHPADSGMVMAGCTEGHGHYLMSNFYTYGNHVLRMTSSDTRQTILAAIEKMAKDTPDYVFGFGFNYNELKEEGLYPTRQEIDAKIKDAPVYLQDSEGHKGLANTCCLMRSGILNPDGTVRGDFKYRHYVRTDSLGRATGMLLEQAGTYVRVHGCQPTDDAKVWYRCAVAAQDDLNKMGYTAAIEGWANKFGMVTYDVLRGMDRSGELSVNWGMAYEIENLNTFEVARELETAVAVRDQYSGDRIHAHFIKLFADGTPESGTGYMLTPNSGGSCGNPIWHLEELRDITLWANTKGMAMHIHAMGDAAVKAAVDAFVSASYVSKPANVRNQIVHLRNVADEDYARMAACDIVASSGVLWHSLYSASEIQPYLPLFTAIMAEQYWYRGYPYRSFIHHRVHTSISTDAPASSGAPTDPFGIMEVAVTGKQDFFGEKPYTTPWDTTECVCNRADFLRSLTIEGAYQMGTEHLRGSIAVGKYADFILISQNVLTCSEERLHDTRVLRTYFEGKCVYADQ